VCVRQTACHNHFSDVSGKRINVDCYSIHSGNGGRLARRGSGGGGQGDAGWP
jgi:hypothetical protein